MLAIYCPRMCSLQFLIAHYSTAGVTSLKEGNMCRKGKTFKTQVFAALWRKVITINPMALDAGSC